MSSSTFSATLAGDVRDVTRTSTSTYLRTSIYVTGGVKKYFFTSCSTSSIAASVVPSEKCPEPATEIPEKSGVGSGRFLSRTPGLLYDLLYEFYCGPKHSWFSFDTPCCLSCTPIQTMQEVRTRINEKASPLLPWPKWSGVMCKLASSS